METTQESDSLKRTPTCRFCNGSLYTSIAGDTVGFWTTMYLSSYRTLMVNNVMAPPSKRGSTWLRRKMTPHVNVVNHRCVNWLI